MMTLSCDCGYGDYDQWFIPADAFSVLDTKRSRKCPSCEQRIPVGATVLPLFCFRVPRGNYEERRFGDEVPMANHYYCEKCAEIYLNLSAVGFCLNMDMDMREKLREYWAKTGFDPKKYPAKEGA